MSGRLGWLGLAAAMAVATWFGGWWTVPVLGAVYGVVSGGVASGGVASSGKNPGRSAALAGAVAWGTLLALPLARGYPVGTLATRLAGAMQLPAAVLVGVTVVLPAFLGGAAAALAHGLRGPKA